MSEANCAAAARPRAEGEARVPSEEAWRSARRRARCAPGAARRGKYARSGNVAARSRGIARRSRLPRIADERSGSPRRRISIRREGRWTRISPKETREHGCPLRERTFGRQGRLGRQEGDLGSIAIFRFRTLRAKGQVRSSAHQSQSHRRPRRDLPYGHSEICMGPNGFRL